VNGVVKVQRLNAVPAAPTVGETEGEDQTSVQVGVCNEVILVAVVFAIFKFTFPAAGDPAVDQSNPNW
jgi:hypothetical protein